MTGGSLQQLLVVQDLDTEADQLHHRKTHLPERARLDQVTAELAAVERDGASVSAQRDELVRKQDALEAELGDLDTRAATIDRQMRSGAITASRDLQAMVEQLDGLKRRKSNLEDTELELMEAIEPLDAQVVALQERWVVLDREAVELRETIAKAESEIDEELSAVIAKRADAAEGLPADLLAEYARLRQRLGGVGAAPLVGSSCGGCHLTLSAGEVDRIRRLPPDAMATCEQCGRILVR